jgi:hypothetical protein
VYRARLCLCPILSIKPPPHRHCGTGIRPGRDIAARRRHITAPRPSLPTALPAPPRTPPGKGRLFNVRGRNPVRHRLSAGGKRIRTIGPAPAKGSSGRCQSETAARRAEPLTGSGPRRQCLPGVAPHSLSLRGGTASSNPSSSSKQSVVRTGDIGNENVPKTWVTTLCRRGCRGVAGFSVRDR